MKPFFAALVLGASAVVCSVVACTGDDPVLTDVDTDSGLAPGADSGGPAADSGMPTGDSGGADSADAAPTTFCDTQAPLTGVTDFFCADFDGTSLAKGWTKSIVPDAGGALVTNTDIFHSAPNSLSTTNDAQLEWDSTGATAFNEINATFQVNVGTLGGVAANQTGHVTLLELDDTIGTNLTLNYAQGASVQTVPSPYTGYYIDVIDCGGACRIAEFPVGTMFTPNVWTQVSLTWTNSGNVRVLYNGIQVFSETMYFPVATKITATLGLKNSPPAPAIARHAFDDVMFSVRR